MIIKRLTTLKIADEEAPNHVNTQHGILEKRITKPVKNHNHENFEHRKVHYAKCYYSNSMKRMKPLEQYISTFLSTAIAISIRLQNHI